jgi:hypothetical protein
MAHCKREFPLVADLGGEAAVTAQQRALVEVITRTKLYVDHLDAYLMQQRSLVHKRKKVDTYGKWLPMGKAAVNRPDDAPGQDVADVRPRSGLDRSASEMVAKW